MELRILDYFLAVAELGTVSAAASRCYVSQPAISRQLAALEQDLSVQLFDRTNTGLRLNAAGQQFYPIARDIRRRLDRGTDLMRSLESGSLGLVVACPLTTMEYVIAPFIASGPSSIADVQAFSPVSVYEQLEHGSADFAVGTTRPPARFFSEPLIDSELMLQFRPGHPRFAAGGRVELAQLEDDELLIPGAGSAIGQVVSAAEVEHELSLRHRRTVSSATVAQSHAASGTGTAIVVEPPLFGLEAAHLCVNGRQLVIRLYAAWEAEHYAASEISAVVAKLRHWAESGPTNMELDVPSLLLTADHFSH
ncbi:LysR family transcriptional regulator [Arthrobacter castelli]|uniref:LysR family transcriptional regulator n=1 Tax=Arthrobacter castelli TaxID=271431 RepID=UPI00047D8B93|nr:LysR family transcriptional regulator [Arthrobacter castelli]